MGSAAKRAFAAVVRMSSLGSASKRFVVASARGRRPTPTDYAAVVPTPFAKIGVRVENDSIVGIDYLPLQQAEISPADPLAREAARQILAYVEDASHAIDLPFAALGTAYQHCVWCAIGDIPSGSTRTYGQLSKDLGSSPRAVGAACGSNPIPLIVPCHRVVSADVRLGGFMHSRDSFPLSIKRWLLAHEMR